jgi:hypothetical protein
LRQQFAHRLFELQLALLDQLHARGGGNGLRHRGNPEYALDGYARAKRPLVHDPPVVCAHSDGAGHDPGVDRLAKGLIDLPQGGAQGWVSFSSLGAGGLTAAIEDAAASVVATFKTSRRLGLMIVILVSLRCRYCIKLEIQCTAGSYSQWITFFPLSPSRHQPCLPHRAPGIAERLCPLVIMWNDRRELLDEKRPPGPPVR